jgi:hypothetical protein
VDAQDEEFLNAEIRAFWRVRRRGNQREALIGEVRVGVTGAEMPWELGYFSVDRVMSGRKGKGKDAGAGK